MNENDLYDSVRTVAATTSTTPLSTIEQRGVHLRRRRRFTVAASGLGVVAIAALAAVIIPSAGTSTGPFHPTAAAWAVEKTGTGTVAVTLNELRDAAGLQRTLEAAGVPAVVQYGYQTCAYQGVPDPSLITRRATPPGAVALFDIDASALPAGDRLGIWADPSFPGSPPRAAAKRGAAVLLSIRVLPEGATCAPLGTSSPH